MKKKFIPHFFKSAFRSFMSGFLSLMMFSSTFAATYTWDNANNTLLISLSTDESISISKSGANTSFTLNSGIFTQSGGDIATGSGTSTITIADADLVSSLTIDNVSISSGTNNVTFSGSGSLSSATININIAQAGASSTISASATFSLIATELAFQATAGVGSASFPINTEIGKLEGSTTNGGIFVSNTGDLTLGGTNGSLSGVTATGTSGIIHIVTSGTMRVVEQVKGSGNVTLQTTGTSSDLIAEHGAINGIQAAGGLMTVNAGRDLILGAVNGFGDVRGQSLAALADRDIVISATTYVQSDGGSLSATAGRDFKILQTNGGGSVFNNNAGNAPVTISTGADGTLVLDQGSNGGISANSGTITINADNISLLSGGIGTSSTVTLAPVTPARSISLGTETSGQLSLTDTELDLVSGGTLVIGTANSGTINVEADISRTNATAMQLISNGDIRINGGGINTGGGTLLLDSGTSPAAVKPTFTGTDITSSTLSFSSDVAIVLNGTTPGNGTGSSYTQLTVSGGINLSGATLALSGTYVPVLGQTFKIVDNENTGGITGTFIGLAEGATISNFLGSNFSASISYIGGDGNDVVITVVCSAFSAPTASVTTQPTCAIQTGTITITAPTGSNIEYSVNGTDYQTQTTFNELESSTYSITAKNTQTGCISEALSLTINPVPTAPTISGANLTQPTCITNTGTAVVNASGTGTLEYSKDGTNWQESNTFSNLTAGNYTFQVRLQNSTTCSASSQQQTINAVPNAPTISNVDLTQPTCATNTGTAVVNATGTGTLEYSKDGTNWQESNTFSNLTAGNYTFQVRLQTSTTCSASSQQQTINPVPTAPTISGVDLTQPTCATNTGTAVVNASGTGTLEYSKDGTNWQESNTFSNLTAGNYTFQVRLQNNITCSASSQQQTINTTPTSLTVFNLQGGTTLCANSSGNTPAAAIVLNGSQVGVFYQLKKDNQNFREPISGTGSNLVFSNITEAGTYTVEAFVEGGACLTNMNGTATIYLGQSPNVFALTGGGSYCNGGNGVAIGLSGSQEGFVYQLRRSNTNIGTPISGTGNAISFGNQTAAGSYTVVATQATSSCNRNMSGSKTVTVTNCNARVANAENSNIESTELQDWATIAPNPVVNSFATVLIKEQANQAIQWQLIDLKGNILKQNTFEITSAHHRQEIPLGNTLIGTYFLKLNKGSRSITLKVVKVD
ncbi:T9SS type A sorting domain-containing protein [Runella zeae]|uniref:T9SS type A sorting domain-containing protein n=1 Tax=Runella zeae TaxID=94255 RepID=UPI0023564823|nr:T9SS type A sorting domain-containing protein [Runella zeae]